MPQCRDLKTLLSGGRGEVCGRWTVNKIVLNLTMSIGRYDSARQEVNVELIIKERDEYQREAAAANAELFSVLKKQEYRSADELALV